MAMHGWMLTGATAVSAVVMGLSLGAYVTSPQSAALPDDAGALYSAAIENDDAVSFVPTSTVSPDIVRCTGCGPTLAERQMTKDMAGLDADGMIAGTNDPVVREYLAAGDAPAVTPTVLPQPHDSAPPVIAANLAAPLP